MTSTTTKHPADAIPDDLILAAIDRAERHRGSDVSGAPIWDITAHLDIGRRSAAARFVRSRLADSKQLAGWSARAVTGFLVWALTSGGRQRMQRADRAGDVPTLPESPQHRRWRDARTLAAQEIERMREAVRSSADETGLLLDARPAAGADAWFELSDRLRRVVWSLARPRTVSMSGRSLSTSRQTSTIAVMPMTNASRRTSVHVGVAIELGGATPRSGTTARRVEVAVTKRSCVRGGP